MASEKKDRPKSYYVAQLDKVFSKFIRLRDSTPDGMFRCISCGRYLPVEQADCGHYINRKHMSLRFNEHNCNAQCRACNRFDEGNIQGYRRGLVQKYGEREVQLLEAMKYRESNIKTPEYKIMIEYYKKKVKEWERK